MSLKIFLKSKPFWIHLVLIAITISVLVYLSLLLLKSYTHHGEALSVPDFSGYTLEQSEMVAKEFKLRYRVIDSVYVPGATPGTVLSQQPVPDAKVKQGRTIYFTMTAISPEKVKLPVVVDVSLREAQSRLENAGFKLGAVEYRPSEFLNLVLDSRLNGQSLPQDTFLVKGTAINLVVGKGLSNETTLIPNLYGLYLNEAKEKIYQLSLNTGALVYDQSITTHDDSANARIWKQSPPFALNEEIELGISVDLWLTIDIEKLGDTELMNLQNDSIMQQTDSLFAVPDTSETIQF
ncbi:MAG: PASTA domain-containing protein [Prolixibacteraceae bacterium]|jgi:beta-lactam-binding protein with PASTA domain|nr:PASTA domain-containing protein [Prolixibacteraceae bacterium]